jgi:hypothetical protein
VLDDDSSLRHVRPDDAAALDDLIAAQKRESKQGRLNGVGVQGGLKNKPACVATFDHFIFGNLDCATTTRFTAHAWLQPRVKQVSRGRANGAITQKS